MKKYLSLLCILLSFVHSTSNGQTITIPGYTGYATPAEDDDEALFSQAEGLHNWNNMKQQVDYFFYAGKKGKLLITVNARNKKGNSTVELTVANKKFTLQVLRSSFYRQYAVSEVEIKDTGFYNLHFKPLLKSSAGIMDIQSITLSGEVTEAIHINKKARRNAASVHLKYPVDDSLTVTGFYNELTVPEGADIVHSYYMACGFARGYFGMQVNSNKERRVIFSVWDAGNEAVDRDKVADSNKVHLVAKGEDVFAESFGNEGTGGHSHWVYNWAAGNTYKFYVTALPDSASQSTIYSGYFYAPELNAWKFIAAFKAPKDGHSLSHLYSFVEDFVGVNGQLQRKAFYGNQHIVLDDGRQKELTKASFSCDVTGRDKDRIDFGGGLDSNRFYLWNGGFKPADAAYGDVFTRTASSENVKINLYHHVDSLAQASKDIMAIDSAVNSHVIDTTGSIDGVYYQIIKEGSGVQVKLTDSVTVHYKGALLNGDVFDETKEEPATFPLNRLIKGWQVGLPVCKVGGRIRLIIPSGLAYSVRSRALSIPPNSILVFDVEVLKSWQ